jgi:N-methylhydantoinase B
VEVLAPEATVSMRIDSVEHPPWGVAGGHAAGTGRCVVNPGRPDERVLRP